MSTSITALYKDRHSAERAIDGLLARGIGENDISVLMSDSTKDKEFAIDVHTKGAEGLALVLWWEAH